MLMCFSLLTKTPFKYLMLLGILTSIFACQENPEASYEGPPNIVLIFADDLGYGDLGLYGHPTIHSPNINQMAHEGIKMTSFYAAAPVCSPSRAALMTGRFPIRVGMPGNKGPDSKDGLNPEERTLAEALKEKGYATAAFGKWHLGAVPGYMPLDNGFDEYYGILYSNDMMPPWVNTKRPLHLYRNNEPTTEQPVDQTTLTKRYTEETIRFIKEHKEEPFFVYLPHAMPHLPVYASADFQGNSKGGRYGDVIEEIDWSVGQILKSLKEEGLDEKTLVILTSDNGPWRNMPPRMFTTEPVEKWHGGTTGSLRGAKATTFDGGMRVPCVIRWPGKIPGGQSSAEIATTMDVHATILELAGAETAPKPLDGKDIWPLLTGTGDSPHSYFPYYRGRTLEAIRDAEWKLRIARPASNWISPEMDTGDEPIITSLFNMKDDPYEHFNQAEDYPEVVERLKEEMVRQAEEIGARLWFDGE